MDRRWTWSPEQVKSSPSALLLCSALSAPALWLSWQYWQGNSFYGEYIHFTGASSARLLILTLAITPITLLFPRARWNQWLRSNRRYLGVACFGYALLHLGAYLLRQPWQRILEEALEAGMGSGWLAMLLMLPLALSSNNWSVRVLRRTWKRLHRSVYLVALLTFAHWVLTAFDPVSAYWHLALLGAIEGLRLGLLLWRRGRPLPQ